MKTFNLTNDEIERIRRAANYLGFPWRPICERPKTARRFLYRVEAEFARNRWAMSSVGGNQRRFAVA
ncbi:MAG: hypothetical protein QNJ00_06300 [Woeseiaceae bacterium]|nr:hypothetical protein [Woeseiaceae bacterium]